MAMVIVATIPVLVGGWVLGQLVVNHTHVTSNPIAAMVVLFIIGFILYGIVVYIRWTRLPKRM